MRPASEQAKGSPAPPGRPGFPLLYELNARCWLRDLSVQSGRPINLGNVPDSEFARWRELGFTHVWLMGVWTTGPRSRQQALDDREFVRQYHEYFGGGNTVDLLSSPFAIADYTVPVVLGGEGGLRKFRQKLHTQGLKLVLDFVPNHVGLDHRWLTERPEIFVHSDDEFPEAFQVRTRAGLRWVAHGKDPNFFSWIDTAQLDYRVPETHEAMNGVLMSVAERCDGVRCDMSMLVLPDVFARNWTKVPAPGSPIEADFWAGALPEVRLAHPGFLFLGEVYWGMEERLMASGFDYVYDKHLYDLLLNHRHFDAQAYLSLKGVEFIRRCAHFLENHDEARIAARLPWAEHRAAALATFGLPGMRMLHEGQLSGARLQLPLQFGRRPPEPSQPEVESLYEYLLAALSVSAVGRGHFELLTPIPAWPDNATAGSFVIYQWQSVAPEFDLVVVNLAPHTSQCHVLLNVDGLGDHNWEMRDLLGEEQYARRGDELLARGLYLDVQPHGAQLFHFKPMGYSVGYLERHAERF